MRIAAIDQGTTSTRVMVVDDAGRMDVVHSMRHQQFHPHAGWVEHDPKELLHNIRACIAAAQALGGIDAIGIANQGESCMAWDARTGEPISPVMVWQDNRTSAQIETLRASGAELLSLERCGLPLDAYFSASKLAWVLGHLPEAQHALANGHLRLGTTDAYFLEQLTGTYATDVSTASRTGLMNLKTGQWDAELCALYGVPMHVLPEIRSTVGRFGLVDGAPVMASVVDQQASLYGHGCRQAGDAKITFGTGAFAMVMTGAEAISSPEMGVLTTVAWQMDGEISYAMDGGVYDASSAVEWAGRMGLFDDVSEVLTFDAPTAISRQLVFVPALSGLACPHWDRSAAAMWLGMNGSTTRQDMSQAVLEGVALRAAEVIRAMDVHMGVVGVLSVDGGLTRNPYFVQFLSNALQRTIVTPPCDELTAFGCAALAARGLGLELTPPTNAGGIFRPTVNAETAQQWHTQFSQAVEKTKGWR